MFKFMVFKKTTLFAIAAMLFYSRIAMAQAAKQPSMFEALILPLLGFSFLMYFLMIRPQQKKMREQQDLLKNLKVGDEIYTTGGIIGRVRSLADLYVTIELSNNVTAKILRQNIVGLSKKLNEAPAKTTVPAKN